MADFKISDNASLALTFPASANSAFARYLTSGNSINAQLTEKQVPEAKVTQLVPSGLSFTEKFDLGDHTPQLTVKAGVEGSVVLKTGKLFDKDTDDFGDEVTVPKEQAYLGASFKATVDAGLADTEGNFKFGLNATQVLTLMNYRRFPIQDGLAGAMQTTLAEFVIPAHLDDIRSMPVDTIATAEGSGSLKFSFKASYPLLANNLATVAIGPLKGITAGTGGLSLGVTAATSGSYQIRVRKIDADTFELDYRKKRGSSFAVTAQAQFGASAAVGGFDVIQALMKAISGDPVVDEKTFADKAGLTKDEIAAIAAAVKAAIDRSLSVSLSDEMDLAAENGAAFSYQIDLTKMAAKSEVVKAVESALRGDLSGLESKNLDGVRPLKSVLSSLSERKYIFKVNLLGIYNYGSVTDLLKKGRVMVNRDTGVISIVDEASAKRVQLQADLFADESKKLRALVATGVTMTAAYHVGKCIPGIDNLKCNSWFFEENQHSKHADFNAYVRDVNTLGLPVSAQTAQRFQSLSKLPEDKLGTSTFHVESDFDTPGFRAMFLNSKNNPRRYGEYEEIGRNALVMQLGGDSNSIVRIHVLQNPGLYKQFVRKGDKQDVFKLLDGQGVHDPALKELVFDDFVFVTWWAHAMSGVAQQLKELLDFLQTNPQVDENDPELQGLRDQLNSAMLEVSSRSSDPYLDHIGGPWGLRVLAEASGFQDSTTAIIISPFLAFTSSRNLKPGAALGGVKA